MDTQNIIAKFNTPYPILLIASSKILLVWHLVFIDQNLTDQNLCIELKKNVHFLGK